MADGIAHSACATDPTPACTCTNTALQEQITLCVVSNCTIKETLGMVFSISMLDVQSTALV
jgi:hypothetical protein